MTALSAVYIDGKFSFELENFVQDLKAEHNIIHKLTLNFQAAEVKLFVQGKIFLEVCIFAIFRVKGCCSIFCIPSLIYSFFPRSYGCATNYQPKGFHFRK